MDKLKVNFSKMSPQPYWVEDGTVVGGGPYYAPDDSLSITDNPNNEKAITLMRHAYAVCVEVIKDGKVVMTNHPIDIKSGVPHIPRGIIEFIVEKHNLSL